ncbi:MAG: T9SS type A sorting domain-containing protein [Bacteroidetes bacterium]|jgi:hypothetical protein|nr:T9SS type A sorting domain-containing protein [Bacteroidota bacterium]MBT5528430.1 T9SS type A sorting domain-containing protein [Cytophagia bacterium]MBT3802832.1 T9SS type A sorting domain-containing protein [Bacteroidota bacterium]MBT4729153.1 T9SS type A sorting domain-containing protein [Bacteroidota bacterium]MBT4969773.1 T9SS type A sorting domain-containing protein [Bacteroidota bacterium]
MKRIFLTLVLSCLLSTSVFSQGGKLGFDNTSGPDFGINLFMDSASSNFWKIGNPNGIVFNEAFQSENAIYIDKNLMNSDTLSSSFTIVYHIIPPLDPKDYCFLHFYYKVDADISESAEFLVSFDYGNSWNSIFDTNLWIFSYYTRIADSTIYTEPPLNGYHADWISCLIDLRFSLYHKVVDDPDSIYFKFKFNAIKQAPTEGIIIDNIRANIAYTDIKEYQTQKIIFKSSIGDYYMAPIVGCHSDIIISIFDISGRKVVTDFTPNSRTIDISLLNIGSGLYIIYLYNLKTKESQSIKIIN